MSWRALRSLVEFFCVIEIVKHGMGFMGQVAVVQVTQPDSIKTSLGIQVRVKETDL